jgi:hypothetical protein
MLYRHTIKQIIWALAMLTSLSFGEVSPESSPLRVTAGASIGRQTPVMATLGLGYQNAILYVEGMGVHKGDNDFWCGLRGTLAWTFFWDTPFNLDFGIGGGYEYARAPNGMNQTLNKANGNTFVFPYNYKESLDLGIEFRAHLYGFYSQVGYPLHHFRKHDEPSLTWRMGYMVHLY